MKSTTKIRSSLVAVLALMLVAAVAGAQSGGGGERRGPGGTGGGPGGLGPGDPQRVAEFLGLGDEQAEAWRAAHEASRERTRPLLEEMKQTREELQAALDAEAPEPAWVGQLAIEQHALRRQLREERERLDQELLQILDEEQRVKWQAFQEARRHRAPHPRGPFGGPGGPGGDAGE